MRVKKFTCHHCGAPKVKPYENPYVVCDYCAHMVDIDYAAGLKVWNHSEEHTAKYTQMKMKFETDIAKYLEQKNKEAYWKAYYNYWDFYYKHYPEYLPPTVPKGEKYELFLKAAADMAANTMHFPNREKSDAYNKAYTELAYYQKDGQNFVEYTSFIKMIHAYLDLQEQGLRIVYDDDQYKIMHELIPEKFQLKMKLSQIAQVWIPYLEKKDGDKFLRQFNLKEEYVEITEPLTEIISCDDCKQEIQIVKGAIICICEHCRHENILKKTTNCHSCGFENELPEDWNNMINCKSCETQLRVVIPLFS
jgi:hypothetical protein